MKRVLFITPSKSIGGINSSLSSLISCVQDKFDIKVLLMSDNGNGEYDFLKKSFTNNILNVYHSDFSSLSGKLKFLALIIKCVKRWFALFSIDISELFYKIAARQVQKKYNFDVVVGFSEGFSMRLASVFAAKKRITWIHCEYDRAVSKDKDELTYYNKFDNIICVSQYTLNKFVERYPALKNKSSYIYNLIDDERIETLSQDSCLVPEFNDDMFTIISVGRMDPVKQFFLIPQIARSLVDMGIIFRWYIIGGPINDEYCRIHSEIQKYRVEAYVIQLGSKSNPYPYMKAADVYVSTSFSEACPMVFIEARLCGLPIVTSNFGSAYEFIEDGVTGFIVPIDDMALKLQDIVRNGVALPEKSFVSNNSTIIQQITRLLS